jgi:hypothetical protein
MDFLNNLPFQYQLLVTVFRRIVDLIFSYWSEHSSASHPYGKTACVFKNTENADMVREISFQAKSFFSAPMKY